MVQTGRVSEPTFDPDRDDDPARARIGQRYEILGRVAAVERALDAPSEAAAVTSDALTGSWGCEHRT